MSNADRLFHITVELQILNKKSNKILRNFLLTTPKFNSIINNNLQNLAYGMAFNSLKPHYLQDVHHTGAYF